MLMVLFIRASRARRGSYSTTAAALAGGHERTELPALSRRGMEGKDTEGGERTDGEEEPVRDRTMIEVHPDSRLHSKCCPVRAACRVP